MFVSKRIVYKANGPMYGRIAKLFWNEQKSKRTVIGATWKAARTGARKNAVVPKAFQAKRKDDTSWSFAAEAIGRLKRRVKDPSYRFTSGWLDLKPPEEEAPAQRAASEGDLRPSERGASSLAAAAPCQLKVQSRAHTTHHSCSSSDHARTRASRVCEHAESLCRGQTRFGRSTVRCWSLPAVVLRLPPALAPTTAEPRVL
mmetsp:Transcript_6211/g.19881  ORF Transcript_6211/g.19881 Transcript_6211/m.19881 type:complete len:201 (+) Transcript_6211:169-771(+)